MLSRHAGNFCNIRNVGDHSRKRAEQQLTARCSLKVVKREYDARRALVRSFDDWFEDVVAIAQFGVHDVDQPGTYYGVNALCPDVLTYVFCASLGTDAKSKHDR